VQTPPHEVWPDVQAWHSPATQDSPVPQALPHEPQFWLLVWVLVQVPPQEISPDVQATHLPAVQGTPVLHALPHEPQFCALVWRFTQLEISPLPQLLSGAVQAAAWQTPPVQLSPDAQAWPHEPQLAWSLERSTQSPLQTVPLDPVQVATQSPAEQSWPLGQARPQPPQFWASVCGLAQPPSQASWSAAHEPPVPPPRPSPPVVEPAVEPEPVEEEQAPRVSASNRHNVLVVEAVILGLLAVALAARKYQAIAR
jgi:hypothetical protein